MSNNAVQKVLLRGFAHQSLNEFRGSEWDTLAWQRYERLVESVEMKGGEEIQPDLKVGVWKEEIGDFKKRRRVKFYEYVRSGGEHAGMTEEEKRKMDADKIVDELRGWDSVKVERIELMENTQTVFLVGGMSFKLTGVECLSVRHFRLRYYQETLKTLPNISEKAFLEFLNCIPHKKLEGIGVSTEEVVEEAVLNFYESVKNHSVEFSSLSEVAIQLRTKPAIIFEGALYFRLTRLESEVSRMQQSISRTSLAIALQNLGAECLRVKVANIWRYELGTESSE